jgi:hypothetical protein
MPNIILTKPILIMKKLKNLKRHYWSVMQHLRLTHIREWVQNHSPTRRERNAFYTQLGRQVEPGLTTPTEIEQIANMLLTRARSDQETFV